MNDLVLDFATDVARVPGTLARLGLLEPRRITGRELKRAGVRGAVRLLRGARVGTCLTLVSELRRPGSWLGIVLSTLIVPATRHLVMDREGRTLTLTWRSFASSELPFLARRARTSRRVCRRVRHRLGDLEATPGMPGIDPRSIVFVRPDLGPGLRAGGSLAHIEGVIGGFLRRGCRVELLSPAEVAGVEARGAMLTIVPAEPRYDLSVELPSLAYNDTLLPRLLERLRSARADLLYQRHALGCLAGAVASQSTGIPLVLEYNGPEVWIARHWGAARKHLDLFREIEVETLRSAHLIVAVSAALREPLVAAGVLEERILINPNGVDADRFAPAATHDERRRIRERIGAGPEEIVAGFVGTFGAWHGAEVLAEAIGRIPLESTERLRFVFVGDGPRRERCEEIVRRHGWAERVVFTGLIPFSETPGWLAACDLCLAPHVPNPDGSPFFGSPTKLFEYMAAGRAVIASDLGQIGSLLSHGRTAWLVPPGDPGALAQALLHLAADPELCRRLGQASLEQVRLRHTWTAHVDRILDRVSARTHGRHEVAP